MNKKEVAKLRGAYEDIVWMAIRYAHGRHTYAPQMVRDSIKKFKEVFPDFEVGQDIAIDSPEEEDLGGMAFRDDYLDDLFVCAECLGAEIVSIGSQETAPCPKCR